MSDVGGECTVHVHISQDLVDVCIIKLQHLARERDLVQFLLRRYETEATVLSRPVKNSSDPVIVHFRPSIRKILDMDEQNQVFTMYIWMSHIWRDEFLTWDPDEYGGLKHTRLPAHRIWTPDIVLYNSLNAGHEMKKGDSNFMLLVHHDGEVHWFPRVIERSSCDLEASDFPFDEQRCVLKYGSWIHSTRELEMELMEESSDMTEFTPNTEWEVIGNLATKRTTKYKCCENLYDDLNYELVLRRKPAFLARFMILPAILLSFMVLVIFWIPPQRPDRTGLAMSLFTSFMVLLLLLVDYTPPTSKSKLASFYCYDIIAVAMATFLSVIVVNISYKTSEMPAALLHILEKLSLTLCLREPRPQINPDSQPNVARGNWRLFALALDRIFFFLYVIYFALVFAFTFPFGKSSSLILWL
ncbi:hypothetical protein CAPTEDRAFT_204062 [Capitella teleta]|uniref:Uncharacterized protein n=1 Tax=Capitella teleta TaxID=283909 RepID=R7V4Y9_CAPTE|nr:hypothetical protein CAPTEDRAFT_204062 [Capitella teleta]|eukprot:ELU13619.1 hypothetical protein CAPTEDRAFT_204062 [Capitella teleta]